MPKFQIEATIPRLDADKWVRATEQQMHDLMVGVARAFLVAALRRIPVRTGFLAGAFTTLEDAIGAAFAPEGGQRTSINNTKARRASEANLRESVLRQTAERNKQLRELKQLERLRKEREANFKKIEELRQAEARRQAHITNEGKGTAHVEGQIRSPYQEHIYSKSLEEGRPLSEKEKLAAKQEFAHQAYKDRIERERLLNEIRKNQDKIEKLAERVERHFNPERAAQKDLINQERVAGGKSKLKHGLELEDRIAKFKEAEHRVQLRREENFHKKINSITNDARLTEQQKAKALERARNSLQKSSERQTKLRDRVNAIVLKKAEQLTPAARARILRQAQKLAVQRFANESGITNSERARAIKQEVNNILRERLQKLEHRSEFQRVIAQAHTKEGFELLRPNNTARRLKDTSGTDINRLNTLARVSSIGYTRDSSGNIIGSRKVSRIRRLDDIRQGETITQFLNRKKVLHENSPKEKTVVENIFREYYYPIVGQRSQRILKTPRSGRRFATPSTQVIIGSAGQTIGAENAGLFSQLAKTLEASGIPLGQITSGGQKSINIGLSNYINQQISSLKRLPGYYIFNYEVNISYLIANEVARGGWLAWTAATIAATQYLNTNAFKAVPDLQEYIVTDKAFLRDLTVKRSSS